jgi:hypothetical protein
MSFNITRHSENRLERTMYEFSVYAPSGHDHLVVQLSRIVREWRESTRHRTWYRKWVYVHPGSASVGWASRLPHPGVPDDVREAARYAMEHNVQYDFG